jgi:hypothetical protein
VSGTRAATEAATSFVRELERRLAEVPASGRRHVEGAVGQVSVRLEVLDGLLGDVLLPAFAPSPGPAPLGPLRLTAATAADVSAPRPPWGPADLRPRDGLAGLDDGRVAVAWAIEREALWTWDEERGEGTMWCRDPAALAPWDGSAPMRPVLAWALPSWGHHLLHGAAVAPPSGGGGVLIVGKGGSGKSTLTMACLAAGWTAAGDDDLAVTELAGCWWAHPLYGWAKVDERSLELLGLELPPEARRGIDHRGKHRLDLARTFPGRAPQPVEIVAIVLPVRSTVSGPPAPAHPAEGLAGLAPSTLLQLPGRRAATMSAMAQLVRGVPAWRLPVGADVAIAGPSALAELLAGLDR